MHQQYPQKEVCYMKWDWDSLYCFFKGWCLYFTKLKPKGWDKGISAMIKGCALYHLGALLARYGPGENQRQLYLHEVRLWNQMAGFVDDPQKLKTYNVVDTSSGIVGRCCYMICIENFQNVTAFANILIQSVQQGHVVMRDHGMCPRPGFNDHKDAPYKTMFGIQESLTHVAHSE